MTKKLENITYGELGNALTKLGFHLIDSPYLLYREDSYGAVVLLPNMPAKAVVLPHHMITARQTVVGKGVADEETFENILLTSDNARITK